MDAAKAAVLVLVCTVMCLGQSGAGVPGGAMVGGGHSGPDFVVTLEHEPSHHLALENQYVRVFQVEVAAHAATLLHQHDRDYVFVSIGAADITNAVQGSAPAEVSLADGDTRFVHGGFAHAATVRSGSPFRNVTVEIKKKSTKEICGFAGSPCPTSMAVTGGAISIGPAGMASADVKFTKETVLETDAVRASRIRLGPGGATPEHEDRLARLLVAVSDLELTNTPRDGQAKAVKMKAGDIVWLPSEGPHMVSNSGTRPAHYVVLELK